MTSAHMLPPDMLPPTTAELERDDARPYFLWWTDATVADLHQRIASPDPEERAYWIGALLREANTRDVWLFVQPAQIKAVWPELQRHLGKARAMWAFLLDLELTSWPPAEAHGA